MREMSRNEHFIRNILALIKYMFEYRLEDDIKEYIDNLEFGRVEQNSLYAKCIHDLKNAKHLVGENYKKTLELICNQYLSYEVGDFNHIKKHTDLRKEKYRQLNLDIPKDKMDKFDFYLKKNNKTKKSVILQAIDNYILENEKK